MNKYLQTSIGNDQTMPMGKCQSKQAYNAVGIAGTLTPLTFLYQEVAKETRDFSLYTSDDV